MLTHFEASNFKSLKDLRLDLPRFMVLVGPNGAGKTNLVRALEVFGEVIRRGTVVPIQEHGYDQLIRREKRPARAGLSFALQLVLPQSILEQAFAFHALFDDVNKPNGVTGPFTLQVGLNVIGSAHTGEVRVTREVVRLLSTRSALEIVREEQGSHVEPGSDPNLWSLLSSVLHYGIGLGKWMAFFKKPSADQFKQLLAEDPKSNLQAPTDPSLLQLINWQRHSSASLLYLRDISQVTRLRLDASALRRDFSFGEHQESLLGPTGEGLASAVTRMRGPKPTPSAQFRKVLEALQEVYPRIQDVFTRRIPSGHLVLLFKERGITEELGQASVSDGVLHALALLVALHQGDTGTPGLLAIEEPENAIHPWPLRKLIARAQQSSRQIILTTHSETVVNAVSNPEALYLVENDDKRGTVVTQATEREAALKSILEESGQRLGDVWLDGSLGGVPGAEP